MNKFYNWCERYFYNPSKFQILLAFILLPISLIYTIFINLIIFKKRIDFKIPIISVGNLALGGSGKTPLIKAIYQIFKKEYKIFIILRGYRRKSKGLRIISYDNKILEDVKISGDEAMEYALIGANVIVSEDRIKGILKAKELGANLILLDDAFSKFNIKKFNILIENRLPLLFCIPSGGYRYPIYFYKFGDFVVKNKDLDKKTYIKNPKKDMFLLSAIANPNRLQSYKKMCVGYKFFMDHYDYKKDDLLYLKNKFKFDSFLVTNKDYVKLKNFDFTFSIIELEVSIKENLKTALINYLKGFKNDNNTSKA